MCDHPEATFADYVDALVQPRIDACGWAVQGVGGSRVHAPFSYTVGLTVQGLPELVLTGRPPHVSSRILNACANHLLQSGPPQPGTLIRQVGELLEIVEVTHPEAHLFVATGLYGEERVQALQLAWADAHGLWPWEMGHRDGLGGQPVFGARAESQRRAG